MLFDRSMCPRNSAPTREAKRVLRQNFRQRVCELIAQRREIGFRSHGFPPLSDRMNVTSKELLAIPCVPLYSPRHQLSRMPCHGGRSIMINNTRAFAFAETVFEREQRREKEIKDALKLEAERQEAAIKNMHRLRALRQERDKNGNAK